MILDAGVEMAITTKSLIRSQLKEANIHKWYTLLSIFTTECNFFLYYLAGEVIVSHIFAFSSISFICNQPLLPVFFWNSRSLLFSTVILYILKSNAQLSHNADFLQVLFWICVCACVWACMRVHSRFLLTLMCCLPPKGCFHFLTPL